MEIGLRWREVAERAQMTETNLLRIRKGDSAIPPLTAARLDAALAWAPGSVDAILAGSEPTPLEHSPPQPAHEDHEEYEQALVDDLVALARAVDSILKRVLAHQEQHHQRPAQHHTA